MRGGLCEARWAVCEAGCARRGRPCALHHAVVSASYYGGRRVPQLPKRLGTALRLSARASTPAGVPLLNPASAQLACFAAHCFGDAKLEWARFELGLPDDTWRPFGDVRFVLPSQSGWCRKPLAPAPAAAPATASAAASALSQARRGRRGRHRHSEPPVVLVVVLVPAQHVVSAPRDLNGRGSSWGCRTRRSPERQERRGLRSIRLRSIRLRSIRVSAGWGASRSRGGTDTVPGSMRVAENETARGALAASIARWALSVACCYRVAWTVVESAG